MKNHNAEISPHFWQFISIIYGIVMSIGFSKLAEGISLNPIGKENILAVYQLILPYEWYLIIVWFSLVLFLTTDWLFSTAYLINKPAENRYCQKFKNLNSKGKGICYTLHFIYMIFFTICSGLLFNLTYEKYQWINCPLLWFALCIITMAFWSWKMETLSRWNIVAICFCIGALLFRIFCETWLMITFAGCVVSGSIMSFKLYIKTRNEEFS